MADVAGQRVAVAYRGYPLPLRQRVALTFTAVVLAACVVAAALLLSSARNERQAIRDHALSTAVALSFGFDQEVAAGNALLRGLSSSPALRSGAYPVGTDIAILPAGCVLTPVAALSYYRCGPT